MMEPSEEIKLVVARFLDAMRDGDGQAVSNRLSRMPGFQRFGSDPAEWWDDGEQAAIVLLQQMREIGNDVPWRRVSEIHAMVEGTVGWAAVQTEFETASGPVPYRVTLVLHLEHGDWRVVQMHSSVPTPNSHYGFTLTTSVDDIADFVRASRPDLSGSSAPDGTVTIAFTDIQDSTRLNEFLGDQRWMELLRAHNDIVRDVTQANGGTIVKGQGDGFMLAFPSARRGLQCARAIQDAIASRFNDPGSLVRVRIGIHVGETIQEDRDFFGHAVAFAARIASHAKGGETVVSSLIHDLVVQTGEFEFGDARHVELKGMAGTQIIYPLAH